MKNNKTITAIILTAGNSTRYKKNINKNFDKINGKCILSYSLNAFNQNSFIDNIIIVAKENEFHIVKNIISKEKISKNVTLIKGGKTRKESVYNSIKELKSDIVIIHDGARPLIKQIYINECIENMENFKGVTIGVKSKDTIKITNDRNIVINTTNRNNTWIIQTPQCFDKTVLLKMHKKYINEDFTDDCSLLEQNGYKIKIIESDYSNLKITSYEDLYIIKNLLEK